MDPTALATSLDSLRNVGLTELTFKVATLEVTLASLSTGDDIVIAQKMEEVKSQGLEYIQSFKLWTLAHAIVALNGQNLRNFKAPPKKVGDLTINLSKEEYLYDIIASWSRPVLQVCFKKYGEILNKAEKMAEDGVVYEIVDLDAEVKRTEAKLENLKEQKSVAASKEKQHPEDVAFEAEKTPQT